jgi:hypothetical protein
VEVYLHSPIRLHDVMFSSVSTGTYLPLFISIIIHSVQTFSFLFFCLSNECFVPSVCLHFKLCLNLLHPLVHSLISAACIILIVCSKSEFHLQIKVLEMPSHIKVSNSCLSLLAFFYYLSSHMFLNINEIN